MSEEMRLIQNNMQVIEELHHIIIEQNQKIEALESVLKEWIDWTLESFNAGVNDEYLEKLKQIKKKLSAKDSGGVDKSIDSLHLSFKCPYCNHQISIKKEDLDGI